MLISSAFNFIRQIRYVVLGFVSRFLLFTRSLQDRAHNGEQQTLVLLSLGGSKGSPFVARSVKQAGYRLVVFALKAPMYEGRFASKWVKVDPLGDYNVLLEAAKSQNPLAILVEQRNILLPVKARLIKDLGAGSFGVLSYKTSNSKIEFRQALDDAQVRNVPWCLLDDFRKSSLDYPVVFKPEKGTGSRGISIVHNDRELADASVRLKEFKDDETVGGRVLLEKQVKGRQFDVEGIYENGAYKPLAFIEEHYDIVGTSIPSAWYLFNPPVSNELEQLVVDSAGAFTKALGVTHGAFHCEMKVTEDQEAYAIDYSNRMGYPLLVSEACGHWFPELYVRVMAGENVAVDNLARATVFQEYVRSQDKDTRYKKLIKKYPQMLVQRNIHFKAAGVDMQSRVALRAESFEHMANVLDEFDLVPVQWEELYNSGVNKR